MSFGDGATSEVAEVCGAVAVDVQEESDAETAVDLLLMVRFRDEDMTGNTDRLQNEVKLQRIETKRARKKRKKQKQKKSRREAEEQSKENEKKKEMNTD